MGKNAGFYWHAIRRGKIAFGILGINKPISGIDQSITGRDNAKKTKERLGGGSIQSSKLRARKFLARKGV